MYKGIVTKITQEYAVLLTEDNQYCKIIVKDGLHVGQKIFFFQEDLVNQSEEKQVNSLSGFNFWRKAVSSSALIACLIFFFLFGNLSGLPIGKNAYYAVVSVDINPSIEMKVNKDKYVTKVEILNQEGYQVAGQYLIGLKIEDAIASIVKKAAKNNYLLEHDTILLAASVHATDEGLTENFAQGFIDELSSGKLPGEYSYLFIPAQQEEYVQAKENDLSLGKYEMSVLSKDTIQPEQVKKMKVKELLEEKEIKSELAKAKVREKVEELQGTEKKNEKKYVWIKDKTLKDKVKDTRDNGKDPKDDKKAKNNRKDTGDKDSKENDKNSWKQDRNSRNNENDSRDLGRNEKDNNSDKGNLKDREK